MVAEEVVAVEHAQLAIERHVLSVCLTQRAYRGEGQGEGPGPKHRRIRLVAYVGEEARKGLGREGYGTLEQSAAPARASAHWQGLLDHISGETETEATREVV